MGFFSNLDAEDYDMPPCCICGRPMKGMRHSKSKNKGFIASTDGYKLKDGSSICRKCHDKYFPKRDFKTTEVQKVGKQHLFQELVDRGINLPVLSGIKPSANVADALQFKPNKQFYYLSCITDNLPAQAKEPALEIDEKHKLIRFHRQVPDFFSFTPKYEVSTRKMSDLVDFELVDDGQTLIDSSSIAGTVVGSVLGGGIGALIGAGMSKKVKNKCQSLVLRAVFNDIKKPEERLIFIDDEAALAKNVNRSSRGYKEIMKVAQECLSVLTIIRERNRNQQKADAQRSAAKQKTARQDQPPKDDVLSQIKKLGELHAAGILTDEEFQTKKKELLARL